MYVKEALYYDCGMPVSNLRFVMALKFCGTSRSQMLSHHCCTQRRVQQAHIPDPNQHCEKTDVPGYLQILSEGGSLTAPLDPVEENVSK